MLDKQAFNQYIDERVCSFEMMMNPAAKGNRTMVRGRVKWFNETKGYGYIIREDDGKEIFVHFTTIDMPGYRSLENGQPVEFEYVDGEMGPLTTRVKPRQAA